MMAVLHINCAVVCVVMTLTSSHQNSHASEWTTIDSNGQFSANGAVDGKETLENARTHLPSYFGGKMKENWDQSEMGPASGSQSGSPQRQIPVSKEVGTFHSAAAESVASNPGAENENKRAFAERQSFNVHGEVKYEYLNKVSNTKYLSKGTDQTNEHLKSDLEQDRKLDFHLKPMTNQKIDQEPLKVEKENPLSVIQYRTDQSLSTTDQSMNRRYGVGRKNEYWVNKGRRSEKEKKRDNGMMDRSGPDRFLSRRFLKRGRAVVMRSAIKNRLIIDSSALHDRGVDTANDQGALTPSDLTQWRVDTIVNGGASQGRSPGVHQQKNGGSGYTGNDQQRTDGIQSASVNVHTATVSVSSEWRERNYGMGNQLKGDSLDDKDKNVSPSDDNEKIPHYISYTSDDGIESSDILTESRKNFGLKPLKQPAATLNSGTLEHVIDNVNWRGRGDMLLSSTGITGKNAVLTVKSEIADSEKVFHRNNVNHRLKPTHSIRNHLHRSITFPDVVAPSVNAKLGRGKIGANWDSSPARVYSTQMAFLAYNGEKDVSRGNYDSDIKYIREMEIPGNEKRSDFSREDIFPGSAANDVRMRNIERLSTWRNKMKKERNEYLVYGTHDPSDLPGVKPSTDQIAISEDEPGRKLKFDDLTSDLVAGLWDVSNQDSNERSGDIRDRWIGDKRWPADDFMKKDAFDNHMGKNIESVGLSTEPPAWGGRNGNPSDKSLGASNNERVQSAQHRFGRTEKPDAHQALEKPHRESPLILRTGDQDTATSSSPIQHVEEGNTNVLSIISEPSSGSLQWRSQGGEEAIMCVNMKDTSLCPTINPLNAAHARSLDVGIAEGFSSYSELTHIKDKKVSTITIPSGSAQSPQYIVPDQSGLFSSVTTSDETLVIGGSEQENSDVSSNAVVKINSVNHSRSKRSADSTSEDPWYTVVPTSSSFDTTEIISAKTTQQSYSSSSTPGSFRHRKVSLFRLNKPSLDLTYITYVSDSETPKSPEESRATWENKDFDDQGRPIIKIGVILLAKSTALFSLNKSRSAIELAGEQVVSPSGTLPGYTIQLVFRDSGCSDTLGPLAGIDLYTLNLANLYIGPSCDYALAPLARFTPYWKEGIPIITAGGLVGAFADKNSYKLLTRMQGSHTKTADFLLHIIHTFGWKRIGLWYHDLKYDPKNALSDCVLQLTPLYDKFISEKIDVFHMAFNEYEEFNDIATLIAILKWKCRKVYINAVTGRESTRVLASHEKTSHFFLSVFKTMGWSTFGVVYYDYFRSRRAHSDCYFLVTEIVVALEHVFKLKAWFHSFDDYNPSGNQHERILQMIEKSARIVVLCASPNTVREIMIKAHELNFDNGEYVFFNIDLFSSKNSTETPWYRPDDTEERNNKARKGYESLMTVTLRTPTSAEYKHFSTEVKARASEMFPNFTYGEDEVNSFVGAFHDAVLLYALALNETLAENGSISDGHGITRRMWNRTFSGITGDVSIDHNGDRNADYSLLDLNPKTNKFEVVANYFGNRRVYEPVPNKTIHWAGGRLSPPPDTPTCGFDGSKCPPEEPFPEYGIVIIVLGSILLIVLIAVFFIYRHIKLEAELAEMNWRVRWDDILFGAPEKNKKLERQGSRLSLRKGSLPSDCSGDTIAAHLNAGNRQLFTRTGYYKGAIIAIKPVPRSNITVNKPMLLEIKRMKDLQNDHMVRFIGACIDYPNSCILTEYCPKGSLQDVLENEQIKLDWMFRYSIMQDIVRGMAYLQGTEIKSHGYLKSTNCVVDSRFVVKITDFGLHHLRGSIRNTDEEEHSFSYFHNKLWTAPELLRMTNRPPEGTIKGDVYSFAIICQEIVYRNGAFYMQNLDLSPQEIYQKVKTGVKPFFRPTLEDYDCPCDELAGVIRRCWAEDPADRPDFQALKSIIRKLNRDGDKGNILDNLLSRMEQYANNLEALVEERTADYLQQKRKAEDLLYNMLPKKVASQLIRGESVTAEWYDSVSIYFSDICGFTAMSAESTPMEVVDLLNDLYTTFDSIIENFDVYKVETIGDAYMVVSGLPDRNGILHAREIARMSLSLLKATLTFRIRHRPKDRLKIRIGIHTGSVCAGVVGLKMPRYCLFGDTVNTASRMESNGLPLKIHVSPQCKEVLDTFGTFELECRGNVEMKGKGVVKTYWLQGEKTTSDSPGVSLNIL